jgi:hypothetical protein
MSMSPERLAEIRRIARGQGGFATTENERSHLRELLAEMDRLTAERGEYRDVTERILADLQAERDRLAARVTQLENTLRQAEEYCARPRGTCFPAEILADSDPAPACPVCRATATFPDGDGGWVCVAGCYYRSAERDDHPDSTGCGDDGCTTVIPERYAFCAVHCPHEKVMYSPTGDDICKQCGLMW